MSIKLAFSAEPLAEFKMYVFDTCVLVAALRSRRGASFLILSAIRQGAIAGVLSEALFLEYADVLKREQNLKQFWTSPEEIDVVLEVLADRLKPIPIYFQWRPQLRDANDEMVLANSAGIPTPNASLVWDENQGCFLPSCGWSSPKLETQQGRQKTTHLRPSKRLF